MVDWGVRCRYRAYWVVSVAGIIDHLVCFRVGVGVRWSGGRVVDGVGFRGVWLRL